MGPLEADAAAALEAAAEIDAEAVEADVLAAEVVVQPARSTDPAAKPAAEAETLKNFLRVISEPIAPPIPDNNYFYCRASQNGKAERRRRINKGRQKPAARLDFRITRRAGPSTPQQ